MDDLYSEDQAKGIRVKRKRIGEILLDQGVINENQLKEALEYQKLSGKRLGEILVDLGYATEEDIAKALSQNLYVPYVDLDEVQPEEEAIKLLPLQLMENRAVLPLRIRGDRLEIAIADPLDIDTLNEVSRITGLIPEPFIAPRSKILEVLSRFRASLEIQETIKSLAPAETEAEEFIGAINLDTAEDRPTIIRLVEAIFREAIVSRATDIHIEPTKRDIRVRYRIDGILYPRFSFSKDIYPEVSTRIKLIANLDITEHRLPQDGHVALITSRKEYDLRISTLPTKWGEKIVVRILDKSAPLLHLEDLGFSRDLMNKMLDLISKPYGFIVVAGPTGSGKTTTLFALLEKLDLLSKNVVTIEDPIEYELENINQTQVNEKAGYTFATGLKHILRQDPDIILIGEIRDKETLNIAIQAALTGHLVLSTIHANDSIVSIYRMRDLGANLSDLLSALIGVISQRLVRVLCPHCKAEEKLSSHQLASLGFQELPSLKAYKPVGCSRCEWRGYKGRTAIGEVLIIDEDVADMYLKGRSAYEIRDRLRREKGFKTMLDDALEKLKRGVTSFEELKRVLLTKS